MIMTPVLRNASIKPELAMLDSDDVRVSPSFLFIFSLLAEYLPNARLLVLYNPMIFLLQDVDDAKDWEVISLGDSQNIGLHTARLEDKAMACQMLVCYARVMKNHFRPYVDEVCA